MESVALLKQENRKLSRQLKEASEKGGSSSPQKAGKSNVTAREVAALSVEHEMLSKQVEEMRQFLAENEGR